MKPNFTALLTAYLLAISLLTANKAFSQLTEWKNYTSNNWVHRFLNDGDYLWIATDGGLVKMNKATQEKIYYNLTNAGFPENNIINIAKDNEGNIWIGTLHSGIGCFNGKQCEIYNTLNSGIKRDGYAGSAIAIDEYNNKWIGTLFFLNKFDGKNWQSWTTPDSNTISSIWVIHSMKFDKNGVLWMGGTASGDWSFAKFDGTEIQILYNIGQVSEIEIDNSNNKWLATNIGLIKYDGEHFTIFNKDNSLLADDNLTDVKLDKDGNLWIVGGNYLTKYDGRNFTTYQVSLPSPTNGLTCLEIDDENIWIGTRRDGVYLFKNGEFKHINCNGTSLFSNDISFCADIDKENNVWIGTANNLIKVDEQDTWNVLYHNIEFNTQRRILGVNCAPNGDMWISLGRSDTCVLRISKKDTVVFTKQNTPLFNMLTEYPNSNFAFDRKGNTWMASRTGLFKYDGNTWSVLTPENSPLPDYMITPLVVDKDDNLWVGSGGPYGGGLCKYDGKEWTIYNEKNSGLPSPFVATMAFDSKNVLWLSCRDITSMGVIGRIFGGGLTRFDGKSWKSYNIDNSGIPSNTIMDIVIDKKDHLWLATYDRVGITKFDGTNWISYNRNNSGIGWDEVSKITLDYKRDLIWLNHLDFGGISTAKLNFDGSGIETFPPASDNSLLVYPNPAKDEITFQLKEGEKPQKVEVYNISGELISSTFVHSNTIALSELNIFDKGVYLLKLFIPSGDFYTAKLFVSE